MHKLFYSSACDYIMSMSTFLAVVYIVGSYHDFNVTCICTLSAAGQLRPLRHHIYRGAVVGVRGAAVGARGAVVGARGAVVGARGAAVGNIGMHTYIRHISAPVHVQVLRSTLQNLRHYILGGCDALVCCFSLQRAEEGRLLLNEVVGGMVMWFRTLAESVVGIKINHGVTLEGPVLRASPGSVEGGVLILLSAVDKVVRIEEELRISLPRQKVGKHNNHF